MGSWGVVVAHCTGGKSLGGAGGGEGEWEEGIVEGGEELWGRKRSRV